MSLDFARDREPVEGPVERQGGAGCEVRDVLTCTSQRRPSAPIRLRRTDGPFSAACQEGEMPRVLVVDDEPDAVELLQEFLAARATRS